VDPTLVAFGFGVGLLVGLTGMGGGSLMTPLLILILGVKPIVAVGTDLAYAAVTKTVGGAAHLRQRTVNIRLALWMAVGSVPSGIAGVFALEALERRHGDGFDGVVLAIVGTALILSALAVLLRALIVARDGATDRDEIALRFRERAIAVTTGTVVGFVLGVSSAGSGPLIAVALILAFRLTPTRVVGTDVAHAAVLLWPVAVAHAIAGNVDYPMAGTILLGSLPGVLIGARCCVRLPTGALRAALGVVMLAAGVALFDRAGVTVPPGRAAAAAGVAGAVGAGIALRAPRRGRALAARPSTPGAAAHRTGDAS
jgi:uncharacterized membrane protein YfcA